MILSCAEMKALEERTFADGATAEALMEEAGAQMARAVRQFFPQPGFCLAVFGKGHNGGDALVAARHLAEFGWETHLLPAFPLSEWASLTRRKFDEAGRCHQSGPRDGAIWQRLSEAGQRESGPVVILDGLLGIGAHGELREPIRSLCEQINRARQDANAHVFALDIPTGMNGDTGATDPNCIQADFTLTVGAAKKGLFPDEATSHVGRLAVLPLQELDARLSSTNQEARVATPASLSPLLPRRNFDSHKGDYGRVGIIAGSRGFIGAALMTSAACVKAGAGLVTLHVALDIYPIVAAAACPEVMVHPIADYRDALELRHDVLAIGPGLGRSAPEEVLDLIRNAPQPMIVDADGLNILATEPAAIRYAAGARLLTPHPGEMARLAPDLTGDRASVVTRWTGENPGTLLLKGARTLVGERGKPLVYNSTGNPGMASGGMGDVLTGVLAALAGQRLPLYEAAQVGAWVCGRAAELAVTEGESVESLTATGLLPHLGKAIEQLRSRCF